MCVDNELQKDEKKVRKTARRMKSEYLMKIGWDVHEPLNEVIHSTRILPTPSSRIGLVVFMLCIQGQLRCFDEAKRHCLIGSLVVLCLFSSWMIPPSPNKTVLVYARQSSRFRGDSSQVWVFWDQYERFYFRRGCGCTLGRSCVWCPIIDFRDDFGKSFGHPLLRRFFLVNLYVCPFCF